LGFDADGWALGKVKRRGHTYGLVNNTWYGQIKCGQHMDVRRLEENDVITSF
jgi:hypothetical protein